ARQGGPDPLRALGRTLRVAVEQRVVRTPFTAHVPLPTRTAPTTAGSRSDLTRGWGLVKRLRPQSILHGPGRNLCTRPDTEFVPNPFDVTFGRPLGDKQALRDLLVRHACRDHHHHLALAPAEGTTFREGLLGGPLIGQRVIDRIGSGHRLTVRP